MNDIEFAHDLVNAEKAVETVTKGMKFPQKLGVVQFAARIPLEHTKEWEKRVMTLWNFFRQKHNL